MNLTDRGTPVIRFKIQLASSKHSRHFKAVELCLVGAAVGTNTVICDDLWFCCLQGDPAPYSVDFAYFCFCFFLACGLRVPRVFLKNHSCCWVGDGSCGGRLGEMGAVWAKWEGLKGGWWETCQWGVRVQS
jgi:hypothetical protein